MPTIREIINEGRARRERRASVPAPVESEQDTYYRERGEDPRLAEANIGRRHAIMRGLEWEETPRAEAFRATLRQQEETARAESEPQFEDMPAAARILLTPFRPTRAPENLPTQTAEEQHTEREAAKSTIRRLEESLFSKGEGWTKGKQLLIDLARQGRPVPREFTPGLPEDLREQLEKGELVRRTTVLPRELEEKTRTARGVLYAVPTIAGGMVGGAVGGMVGGPVGSLYGGMKGMEAVSHALAKVDPEGAAQEPTQALLGGLSQGAAIRAQQYAGGRVNPDATLGELYKEAHPDASRAEVEAFEASATLALAHTPFKLGATALGRKSIMDKKEPTARERVRQARAEQAERGDLARPQEALPSYKDVAERTTPLTVGERLEALRRGAEEPVPATPEEKYAAIVKALEQREGLGPAGIPRGGTAMGMQQPVEPGAGGGKPRVRVVERAPMLPGTDIPEAIVASMERSIREQEGRTEPPILPPTPTPRGVEVSPEEVGFSKRGPRPPTGEFGGLLPPGPTRTQIRQTVREPLAGATREIQEQAVAGAEAEVLLTAREQIRAAQERARQGNLPEGVTEDPLLLMPEEVPVRPGEAPPLRPEDVRGAIERSGLSEYMSPEQVQAFIEETIEEPLLGKQPRPRGIKAGELVRIRKMTDEQKQVYFNIRETVPDVPVRTAREFAQRFPSRRESLIPQTGAEAFEMLYRDPGRGRVATAEDIVSEVRALREPIGQGMSDAEVQSYLSYRSQGATPEAAREAARGNTTELPSNIELPTGEKLFEKETREWMDLRREANTPPPEASIPIKDITPDNNIGSWSESFNLFGRLRRISEKLYHKVKWTEDSHAKEMETALSTIEETFAGMPSKQRILAGKLADTIKVRSEPEIAEQMANNPALQAAPTRVRAAWEAWQKWRIEKRDEFVRLGLLKPGQVIDAYLARMGYQEAYQKLGVTREAYQQGKLSLEKVNRLIDKNYEKVQNEGYELGEIGNLKETVLDYLQTGVPQEGYWDPYGITPTEVPSPYFKPRLGQKVYQLDLEKVWKRYAASTIRSKHWDPLAKEWKEALDTNPAWNNAANARDYVSVLLQRELGKQYWADEQLARYGIFKRLARSGNSTLASIGVRPVTSVARLMQSTFSNALVRMNPKAALKQTLDMTAYSTITGEMPGKAELHLAKGTKEYLRLARTEEGLQTLHELGLYQPAVTRVLGAETLPARGRISLLGMADNIVRGTTYFAERSRGKSHHEAKDVAEQVAGRYTRAALGLAHFTPLGRLVLQFAAYPTLSAQRMVRALRTQGWRAVRGFASQMLLSFGSMGVLTAFGMGKKRAIEFGFAGGGLVQPVGTYMGAEDDWTRYLPHQGGPVFQMIENVKNIADPDKRAKAERRIVDMITPGGGSMRQLLDATVSLFEEGKKYEGGTLGRLQKKLPEWMVGMEKYEPTRVEEQTSPGRDVARLLGWRTQGEEDISSSKRAGSVVEEERERSSRRIEAAIRDGEMKKARALFRSHISQFPAEATEFDTFLRNRIEGATRQRGSRFAEQFAGASPVGRAAMAEKMSDPLARQALTMGTRAKGKTIRQLLAEAAERRARK